MAAKKANRERYRNIRSVILSLSILSFLPLFGLMKGAVNNTSTSTADTTSQAVASAPVQSS